MKTKKIISILLVLVFALSLASGCKKRDETEVSSSSTSSSSTSSSSKAESKKPEDMIKDHLPGMAEIVKEYKQENADSVGWLQVTQLNIGDIVVCHTGADKNEYYRRRNFKKENAFNGVLYADFRSTFGDGSAEQLALNTCIYGHALSDIRGEKNYDVFFGPLHDFRDPEIAKTIPYIYFTTEKEDLAFEVFAVFITNTSNPDMPYNRPDVPEEDFHKMIKEQVLPRSLYNYDVEIKPGDKFLTLSTCIYNLPNGSTATYPSYLRYGIMAKLVDSNGAYKEEASMTINEHPVIDAEGKIF